MLTYKRFLVKVVDFEVAIMMEVANIAVPRRSRRP